MSNDEPQKWFQLHNSVINNQIINYKTDKLGKNCVLAVIQVTQFSTKAVGILQLYSQDQGKSQIIEGHQACFIETTYRNKTCTVFSYITRQAVGNVGRLCIAEIGGSTFPKSSTDFRFNIEAENDIPVTLDAGKDHRVLYSLSKDGWLFIFDLFTGTEIYNNRVTVDMVFATVYSERMKGVVGVNRKGQVLSIFIV